MQLTERLPARRPHKMHHRLPILSFLLTITLIHIPKSLCQTEQYRTCEQVYQCGGFDFRYPFWAGSNRPNYCGYPGFEVTCDSNVPKITVSSITYRVLGSPDTGEKTVRLARDDLFGDICAANDGDQTVFNSTMFSYSDTQNLTILYTCPPISPMPQNLNLFTCTENGVPTRTSNYFILSDSLETISGSPDLSPCTPNITVPVRRNVPVAGGDGGLRGLMTSGFVLGYEAENDECDRCSGQCGYNIDSSSFACYCPDDRQDCYRDGRGSKSSVGLSAGLATIAGAAIAGLLVGGLFFWCRQRKRRLDAQPSQTLPTQNKDISDGSKSSIGRTTGLYCMEIFNWRSDEGSNPLVGDQFMKNYGSIAPRVYTYAEIKKVTNSFSTKLGHGGYGCVYRGKLSDGRQVAVKLLNDNKGNGEDFINEVAAISRTSHVNVVALLGFCCNRTKRALIYEFMPNGSLEKFIGWKGPKHLEWKLLYQIAMGIARGLEYLHRGCNTRIVHLDIKPQNILLDADFHPKISDFGLAKIYKNKESVLSTMGARGTVGYIAPEMVFPSFGGVSHKSDVYSYGMMVLEMVGLTKKLEIDSQQTSETYFPNWIHERVELGEEIPLKGVTNEEEKESAMKMIYVGLWCIQPNPFDRPSISKVVEMLEGSLDSLQIPPRPYLASSTTMNFNKISWTTSSVS